MARAGRPRTAFEAWAWARNLGHDDLIALFDRHCRELGEQASLGRRHLARLLAGEIETVPHPATRRVLERMTGIRVDSLFLQPPSQHAGIAHVGVDLERAIMDAAHETSAHAMDAGAAAAAEETLEQLREDVIRIARDFDNQPPGVMFGETLRVRNLAFRALERTRRPAQQTDLYLVAAQCAGLACGACMDLSLWDAAMEFARAGYTYAEVIDHDGARAYSRGMQAQVAYWTGRTREALQYALAAAELAPVGVARVRAQSVLARAWSYRGGVAEVHTAVAAADAARDAEGSDDLHDRIGGEFGFSEIRQARCGGTAFLRVGEAEEAARHTRRALELYAAAPPGPWSTVEAEARADLAASQLLTDQLEAAGETLAPIWDMPVAWRRNGLSGRVDHLHSLLSAPRWRSSATARSLADHAEDFVAARAAALPGERLALPHA